MMTKYGVLESKTGEDTLIFVHVVFRHGQRNIVRPYLNDPYKDEDTHWPNGFGQLTNVGKMQLFTLGQYFRRRYEKLIGKKYSTKTIYTQSTAFDRTIMSANLCLAGLYPPTDVEKWNDTILWQPIPVYTVPVTIDRVLTDPKYFPEYRKAREHFLKESSELQRIFTEYADLFEYWSQRSGWDLTCIENNYSLYNILSIEKEQNKPLEDWAEDAIKPNGILEYIAKFFFKVGSSTPQLAKYKSGFLIKEMIERFKQKINSTLSPDRSIWLYSAHDFTIANLLNSLGIFDMHIPPYAASLHFELYKTKENEHYFQIFYRRLDEENPLPMNIPGCGSKCSLDQFCEQFKEIIPDDTEC